MAYGASNRCKTYCPSAKQRKKIKMKRQLSSSRCRNIVLLACAMALLSCACSKAPPKIDFAFTGRVLDKESKQPIEGAYVVAIYKTQRAGAAAVKSHCTKTRGMLTGKDGKFSFPVEGLNDFSPAHATAIHLDYVPDSDFSKPYNVIAKHNAESYRDRNIFLEKHKSEKNFVFVGTGISDCVYAANPQDAAAAAEFARHELARYIKYDTGLSQKVRIEATEDTICRLETLDGRMPYEIVATLDRCKPLTREPKSP